MQKGQANVGRGSDRAGLGAAINAFESGRIFTGWTCEKWSEDACIWVRNQLDLPEHAPVGSQLLRDLNVLPDIGIEERPGNLLLNEGIQEMLDIIGGIAGITLYNNANAEIGVGDSATAAAATQTDLQAGANKLFKAMVATYPQRTAQTMDWRSDFTSSEANFAWQEWGMRNGNTRNKNLNRKVESLGTKATGTWTMTGSLTLA